MILLMGHFDSGGNLIIESSDEFPDDHSQVEIDVLVAEKIGDVPKGFAHSYLVDSHSRAVNQAYQEIVRDGGDENSTVIDNVWGVLVDD
ncbi:hypothetical protein OG241_08495 [Streptomyces sp. NBC_01390]|uniref:hypothetical protein n=1 Tax=Streptomyces sp. NBC_01390 TaxID=2903850 RepID=UPI00324DDCF7